ncbi:MAG TPA: oxidoreductase [Solirubrobacteraceae bacterium]|nr:oxidoreductase [Solirubrobacteraceae bacterium]
MKTWLITGCSSGFGSDIAAAALERGDNVVATARRPETLAGLDGALKVALDVTDPAQIEAAVAAALERFGGIDVLVNNAGIGSVGAVEMIEPEHLRQVMETMFFGAVALTQAVLPHMRARGEGAIVQISSMGGQVVFPGYGAYCAAKFALEAMSEALAAEVGPLGIKVVIVEPGAFRTALLGSSMHRSPEIDAYAGTANATRAAAEAMDGTQAGDPRRAAEAIADAVAADDPPLHLALGEDALEAIRAAQDARRADLDRWADVSRATALSP